MSRTGRTHGHSPVDDRPDHRSIPSTGAAMTTPDADEVPLWNIANILTVVRCVMVPLLVVLAALYAESAPGRLAVTVVFLLAMLTDLLDGHLARRSVSMARRNTT